MIIKTVEQARKQIEAYELLAKAIRKDSEEAAQEVDKTEDQDMKDFYRAQAENGRRAADAMEAEFARMRASLPK